MKHSILVIPLVISFSFHYCISTYHTIPLNKTQSRIHYLGKSSSGVADVDKYYGEFGVGKKPIIIVTMINEAFNSNKAEDWQKEMIKKPKT